jgi:hypothetical protein
MNFDPVTTRGYLAPVVMGEAWESPSGDKNPSQPKRWVRPIKKVSPLRG